MALFKRKRRGDTTSDAVVLPGTETVPRGAGLPAPVAASEPPARAELQWGMPSRCPECGDFGYLDRVDLVSEVMFQHCPTCWSKWQITKADVDASSVT